MPDHTQPLIPQTGKGEPVVYESWDLLWVWKEAREDGARQAVPARRDPVAVDLLSRCGEGTAASPWDMDAMVAFVKHLRDRPHPPDLVRDDGPEVESA